MRKHWVEITAALGLLLCGFGAVATIYLSGTWPVEPTLWHYRSATFGDGVLLPTAVGLLAHLARRMGGRRRDWFAFSAFFVIGAAGGALVIRQWLTDPHGGTNWTMPQPGVLNVAGVYHAVFLIVSSGLISGLLALVLLRMRGEHAERSSASSAAWTAAVACLLGFVALLVADNPRPIGQASASSVVAVGVSALFWLLATPLITRCGWKVAARTTVIAGIGASSIGYLSNGFSYLDLRVGLLALIALAGAAALAADHALAVEQRTSEWILLLFVESLLVLLAWGVRPAAAKEFSLLGAALSIVIAAIALSVLLILINRMHADVADRRPIRLRVVGAVALPISLVAFGVLSSWLSAEGRLSAALASLILVLVSVAILNVISPLLQNRYHAFVLAEEASTQRGRTIPEQSVRGTEVAIYLCGVGVGGIAALLQLTVAVATTNGFLTGVDRMPVRPWTWAAVGVVLVAALIANLLSPRGQRSSVAAVIVVIAAATWSVIAIRETFLPTSNLVILVPCLLAALWTFNTTKINGALLQREDVSVGGYLAAIGVAVAVGSSVIWLCTNGLRSGGDVVTVGWSSLSVAVIAVANLTLALTAVRTCFPEPSDAVRGTNYSGTANVVQDQLLIFMLTLVLAWLPSLVIAHVPVETPERWTSILLILYSFMFLLSAVYFWVLRYNTRHGAYRRFLVDGGTFADWPKRQRFPLVPTGRFPQGLRVLVRRRAHGISDREWVDILEDHITTQNTIALAFVLVPVITLVPFLNEIRVRTPD
jgi:hypothetical protein